MDNDILLAIPLTGEPDADLLRAFLVKRIVYVFEETENPSTFVALVNGAVPIALGYQEKVYWLDPNDTTSPSDAVTIHTSDDYVYKANIDDLRVKSVLDRDLTDPPLTGVNVGDTYLVPAGATGDWAGFDNYLARWSLRGWMLIMPRVGDWIYIEDEDAYVRFTALGTWEIGPGNRTFDDASIPMSAAINFGRFVIVENQTTNAPPGAPAVGVAYIIGSSPAGDWLGQAGKVAICEIAGVFTIYPPPDGMRAYDKAQEKDFQFNGGWQSSSGAFTFNIVRFIASGTYSKPDRLIGIIAKVIGGGGASASSNGGGSGSTGGTTSLGALLSATGGVGGSSAAGGAGGTGSGGDINRTGQTGGFQLAGVSTGNRHSRALPPGGGDLGTGGRGLGDASNGIGDGGAGGSAEEWLAASELSTNETVTIGAGASNGSGGTFEAGTSGEVVIIEVIEA